MKSNISKKLTLKKVTISTYKIYGAIGTPIDDQDDITDPPTFSSAYHDPTEINSIDSLYLSRDADVCA
ncbi:hypothetical protein [uncultured Kordia sp.]|uniref:hypothetical protein n=1 Tax=uncultured Kordia sp. TaxID=507699 RepID=UPI00262C68D2|nr:hypothetical protein [uncultured Kordia sp.]